MALNIKTVQTGPNVELQFDGAIDEACKLPDFPSPIAGNLKINLDKLTIMNSMGCRKFGLWLRDVAKARDGVFLTNCTPAAINQINILEGFLPKDCAVQSFYAPYFCESCQHSESQLFSAGKDYDKGRKPDLAEEKPCPKCGETMELEVVKKNYLKFLG